MASAIITEATPTKNRRNLGWRRAANDLVSLMARKLLEDGDGPTRRPFPPHLRARPPGRAALARTARRVPALRLDGGRGTARQPAGHGGARRRGADPLCPGQHLSDPAHAFLWRLQREHGLGRRGEPRAVQAILRRPHRIPREHRGPDPQARGAAVSRDQRALRPGTAPAQPHAHLSLHRRRRPLGDARRLPAGHPRGAGEARPDRHHPAGTGPHRLHRGGGAHHARLGELRSAHHMGSWGRGAEGRRA